jgi:hypothetical protein
LQRYAIHDGLIEHEVPIDALFATNTLDRFRF